MIEKLHFYFFQMKVENSTCSMPYYERFEINYEFCSFKAQYTFPSLIVMFNFRASDIIVI